MWVETCRPLEQRRGELIWGSKDKNEGKHRVFHQYISLLVWMVSDSLEQRNGHNHVEFTCVHCGSVHGVSVYLLLYCTVTDLNTDGVIALSILWCARWRRAPTGFPTADYLSTDRHPDYCILYFSVKTMSQYFIICFSHLLSKSAFIHIKCDYLLLSPVCAI